MKRFERGAMRPTILDILTAFILLAILLWASWKQFPAYNRKFTPRSGSVSATPRPAGKF
jgi:hypothetical protein